VRVTNLNNGKDVIVRVNDRGPFAEGRIIDLSYAAANKIGMIGKGTVKVRIEVIELGEVKPSQKQ
jgi:rare lipoprotein A